VIVVGAHMDSISPEPQNSAPGCVDNGSGAEGLLLLSLFNRPLAFFVGLVVVFVPFSFSLSSHLCWFFYY